MSDLTNPNVRKFLDFLGKSEGADYNTIVGGGQFSDFSKHPATVGLTTKEGPSTAAGKYQITKRTYDSIAPSLGVTGFTPEDQDKVAVGLLQRRGALDDVKNGDFMSAIGKLGQEWASLPSSPYKQSKRSMQWVSQELGIPTEPKSNPAWANVGGKSPNIGGANPSTNAELEAKQRYEHGGFLNTTRDFFNAIGAGIQLDNSVVNYYKTKALENVDPSFSWMDEDSKKALDQIPERHWDYVLQAMSAQERDARLARVQDQMKMEEKLSGAGVAGLAGRFIGGMADPVNLLAFVPGLGEAALLSKTSRLSNAVCMGLINAGQNVAIDALTMKYRPLSNIDDLYGSAMMGFGLGAGIGFGINPKRIADARFAEEYKRMEQAGMRENAKVQLQEFQGLPTTELGENYKAHLSNIAKGEWRNTVDGEVKNLLESIRQEGHEIRKQYLQNPEGSELYRPVNAPRSEPKVESPGGVEAPKVEPKVETPAMPPESTTIRSGIIGTEPKTRNGVKGKTMASNVLDEIIAKNADPLQVAFAQRLKEQLVTDVPVYTVNKSDMSRGAAAYYHPGAHHIAITKDTLDTTKLHEIAHALTVYKLDYGLKNPETAHGQLTKEFMDLYEQAKTAAKDAGFSSYYLSNHREFAAGIYGGTTAKPFQDFLKSVKQSDGGNLFTRFVDTIRKLLGMDAKETNLWLKSLDVSDRLIDEKLDVHLKGWNGEHQTVHYDAANAAPGVDPETVQAANEANIPRVYGWSLGLEHKLGGKDAPAGVRQLAAKLFGTTVGYKDHSVVKGHAWEDTTKWAEGWIVSLRKETDTAFGKWFQESGRSRWEKGEAYEEFGTQVSNYVRGFDGEYDPLVKKAGDAVRRKMDEVREYINNPLKDEGGKKRGLTEQEIVNPETGEKTIVGTLESNPNYLPRKHDINKWNHMVTTYGREAVENWWAGAFKAGRDGISDEVANRWAKWYVRTVEEAHADRKQDLLEELMRGTDREALKLSLMQHGGFDEQGAMRVIENMLPTKESDAGRTMASLKHRNTINEGFTQTFMKDGEKITIGLNDFIHSNAFEVVEPYLRRTASSVALAKHLDVYKVGDIDRLIHEATQNKLGQAFRRQEQLDADRKNLQFAFERIQGLPMENFSWWGKALQMWRDFNVIRLMGGTVWNQATESAQIIGSMGWKATLAAIPELKALKRDIETGKAPHDILDHLENTIGGAGSEYVARMEFKPSDDWVRHRGDTFYNRWLDKTDNALKKVAKGTLDYTGMTPLMIQQKRVHAVALVNHFVETAHGKPSSFLSKERLAWMGMDESDAKKVFAAIKEYTSPKQGEFGKAYGFDIKKFATEAPMQHSQLMTAIHRESRRVIQENDLSSMIPLMGNTLAKTVFQFQSFSFHGWNKSMLYAMNHRDWSTFSAVMHGALFAGLAYMGRTMLDSAGLPQDKQQQFLDKRMNLKQIVANSFGRVPQAGLLPQFYDTLSPFPMFSGMRTTSDISSFAANPTLQALNSLISMKKMVSNALDDEKQTTEKDIRTWGRLAPWSNIAPVSTLINMVASDYPTSDHER